jgi:hypothetical protein
VRDAFAFARRRIVFAGEFPEATNPEKLSAYDRAAAWQEVYNARLQQLGEASAELETAVLEAEVLWGSDPNESLQAIHHCRGILFFAIDDFIHDEATDHTHLKDDSARRLEVHSAIAADRDGSDLLSTRMRDALGTLLEWAESHEKA